MAHTLYSQIKHLWHRKAYTDQTCVSCVVLPDPVSPTTITTVFSRIIRNSCNTVSSTNMHDLGPSHSNELTLGAYRRNGKRRMHVLVKYHHMTQKVHKQTTTKLEKECLLNAPYMQVNTHNSHCHSIGLRTGFTRVGCLLSMISNGDRQRKPMHCPAGELQQFWCDTLSGAIGNTYMHSVDNEPELIGGKTEHITSYNSNVSNRLHCCHCRDRSIIFARWRQCAPPSNT